MNACASHLDEKADEREGEELDLDEKRGSEEVLGNAAGLQRNVRDVRTETLWRRRGKKRDGCRNQNWGREHDSLDGCEELRNSRAFM